MTEVSAQAAARPGRPGADGAGPDPLLEIRGIRKSFGDLLVLDDVSFAVPSGQALGIVGPNGAGKSTLLDIVSGTQAATSGHVLLDGTDVTRRGPAARCRSGVGRSFQIPRPFADLTVYENVLVGAARNRGTTARGGGSGAAREAALDALDATAMMRWANVRAAALPLLDRKRLELARALATRPRLLLLDEIAGGLTEPEAQELVHEILSLKASGVTIVWIEHVVKALVQVVDRLICLAFGSVLSDGDPADVLRSPEVREVYLGRTPA